jgi:hypothetical protein
MRMGRWNRSGNLISRRLYKGLDGRGKILSRLSLSTFAFSAHLFLSAFAFSMCLLLLVGTVMAHIKTTAVSDDPKDSADVEIVDASISDDVVETSSTFDQDARENAHLEVEGIMKASMRSLKMMMVWITMKPPMMKMLILLLLLQLLAILSTLVLRP